MAAQAQAAAAPVESTLNEPILDTILRDLRAIGRKTLIVAIPTLGRDKELRDWDLWGPLLLCLILAVILGANAADTQKGVIFAAVFILVWLGSGLVTINAKFLGANVSFFQTICVMGYCVAPMCLAAIITSFIPFLLLRLVIDVLALAWSTYASLRFIRGTVKAEREVLVVYPVFLFYTFMTWMMAVGI